MENTASPAPVPPVPIPSTKRGFPYQTVVVPTLAVAALFMSGKGWLMLILGPFAVLNLVIALTETIVCYSKERKGTLHHLAWPLLLSYQVAFFFACFSAPFVGDTKETSAFTIIKIPDSHMSVLDDVSFLAALLSLLLAFVFGFAVLLFLPRKDKSSKLTSLPLTVVSQPTMVSSSNSQTQMTTLPLSPASNDEVAPKPQQNAG